jgi:hypothetical protein
MAQEYNGKRKHLHADQGFFSFQICSFESLGSIYIYIFLAILFEFTIINFSKISIFFLPQCEYFLFKKNADGWPLLPTLNDEYTWPFLDMHTSVGQSVL